MPIEIRHDLDPALTGALSYLAGQRQYRNRQTEQERALFAQNQKQMLDLASQRDAELARERMIRERPDEPRRREVSRPLNRAIDTSLAETALRADVAVTNNRDQIYGNLINRLLLGRQQQDALQMQLQDREANRLAEQGELQFDWGADSAVVLEGQIKDIQKNLSKQQQKLTPDGKQKYGELMGKLRSIQKFRANMRPADYVAKLGQWLEEYNAAGIEDFIEEPPTPDQLYQQSVYPIAGSSSAFVVDPATGKGNIQKIELPPTPEEIKLKEEERQFEREKHVLDINKTRVAAYSDWMKSMPKMSDFMEVMPGKPGPDGAAGPSTMNFNEEQFQKVMAYWQSMDPTNFGFGQEQGLPSVLQGEPAPGEPLSANQPVTPAMTGQQPAIPEPTGPAQTDSLSPSPEFQGFNSMHEAAAALNNRQAAPPDRIAFYRSLGVDTTAEGYPIMTSEKQAEEFHKFWLRPKEIYVDPDGKLRRKS